MVAVLRELLADPAIAREAAPVKAHGGNAQGLGRDPQAPERGELPTPRRWWWCCASVRASRSCSASSPAPRRSTPLAPTARSSAAWRRGARGTTDESARLRLERLRRPRRRRRVALARPRRRRDDSSRRPHDRGHGRARLHDAGRARAMGGAVERARPRCGRQLRWHPDGRRRASFERIHSAGPIELFRGAAASAWRGSSRSRRASASALRQTAGASPTTCAASAWPTRRCSRSPSTPWSSGRRSSTAPAARAPAVATLAFADVSLPGSRQSNASSRCTCSSWRRRSRCWSSAAQRAALRAWRRCQSVIAMLAAYRSAQGLGARAIWLPTPMPLMRIGAASGRAAAAARLFGCDYAGPPRARQRDRAQRQPRPALGRAPAALADLALAITPPEPALDLRVAFAPAGRCRRCARRSLSSGCTRRSSVPVLPRSVGRASKLPARWRLPGDAGWLALLFRARSNAALRRLDAAAAVGTPLRRPGAGGRRLHPHHGDQRPGADDRPLRAARQERSGADVRRCPLAGCGKHAASGAAPAPRIAAVASDAASSRAAPPVGAEERTSPCAATSRSGSSADETLQRGSAGRCARCLCVALGGRLVTGRHDPAPHRARLRPSGRAVPPVRAALQGDPRPRGRDRRRAPDRRRRGQRAAPAQPEIRGRCGLHARRDRPPAGDAAT